MPEEIGIRELKNRASSLVRQVREEAAEYIITLHGRPVAVLRPVEAADLAALDQQKALEAWEEVLAIGRELAESGPPGVSAVDTLLAMRDEENEWPS